MGLGGNSVSLWTPAYAGVTENLGLPLASAGTYLCDVMLVSAPCLAVNQCHVAILVFRPVHFGEALPQLVYSTMLNSEKSSEPSGWMT